jgi:hypothetical protein
MREYKIENSDLWYKIFRHPKEDEQNKEYYSVSKDWDKKNYARIFFHRADAESALVIIRTKWKKETESTSSTREEKVEKQSWSELS